MDDWQSAALPWIAIGISITALFISWLSYRVSKSSQLSERPYFDETDISNGQTLKLCGDNAEHWQLKSIRLLWPLTNQFCRNDGTYDPATGKVKPIMVPVGRKIYGCKVVFVSDSSRPSFLWAKAESKTRPKYTIRRFIRVRPITTQ